MRRFTKVLLLLTLVTLPLGLLFLFGVINVENIPELYVVFPVGASLFGLFLICRLMEKEVAAFDAEQRAHADSSPADSPRYVGDHEHSSPIESRIGHVERAKCLAGWFGGDHAAHPTTQDCSPEIKPACRAVAFGDCVKTLNGA